jgi:hypothetical protein
VARAPVAKTGTDNNAATASPTILRKYPFATVRPLEIAARPAPPRLLRANALPYAPPPRRSRNFLKIRGDSGSVSIEIGGGQVGGFGISGNPPP